MVCLLLALCLLAPFPVGAVSLDQPQHLGLAMVYGTSYAPQPAFRIGQLSLMALYDYEQIMPHPAPEPLRFKIEGSVGFADPAGKKLLVSANIFALYYLRNLETRTLSPYVEGGIGLVYSDFQVEGQGLRLNFNPQAGIGSEWLSSNKVRWYAAFRGYHLSNGNLYHENHGINAFTLQVGRYF